MKKLFIFATLASPSFAHDVTFRDPKFYGIAGKDLVKANNLYTFCIAEGMASTSCKNLGGMDSRQLEAINRCGAQLNETPEWMEKYKPALVKLNELAHPGRTGHFHRNEEKNEKGEAHRHKWGKFMQDEAVRKYRSRLLESQAKDNVSYRGKTIKTSGSSASGGLGVGVKGMLDVHGDVGGNNSTTKELGAVTDAQFEEISFMAEEARLYPWLGDVEPDIYCAVGERCVVDDGTTQANDPKKDAADFEKARAEREAEKKKHEEAKKKKAAASAPTDEHKEHKDIDVHHVGKMAGEAAPATDAQGNPVVWATPAERDPSYNSKSPLEQCAQLEYHKILSEESAKHKSPDAATDEKSKEKKAKADLLIGICDASFFGQDFCTRWKIKRQTIDGKDDNGLTKEEKRQKALETFRLGGSCDENVLGKDFCRAEIDKIEMTKHESGPAATWPSPKRPNPIPRQPFTPGKPGPGNGQPGFRPGTPPQVLSGSHIK